MMSRFSDHKMINTQYRRLGRSGMNRETKTGSPEMDCEAGTGRPEMNYKAGIGTGGDGKKIRN